MIMQDYHGVKLGSKSDYVICERSLMVLLNGWKFINQSLISPYWWESLFEKAERNIVLNILILILLLTLKSIKVKKTAINSLKTSFKHLHSPTTKLETDLAKFLKRRNYSFNPQLTCRKIFVRCMQHGKLQSSFRWLNFAVMRMNSHKVTYMIVLLVSIIVLKVL